MDVHSGIDTEGTSNPRSTHSAKAQIRMELRFAKMFFWCYENWEYTGNQYGHLARFVPKLETAGDGRKRKWCTFYKQWLEKVDILMPEIKEISLHFIHSPSEGYKSSKSNEIHKFLVIVDRNLEDLLCSNAQMFANVKEQVELIQQKLKVTRDLVKFTAERCSSHEEELKDFRVQAQVWTNRVACLVFLYWVHRNEEEGVPNLKSLLLHVLEIKPFTHAVKRVLLGALKNSKFPKSKSIFTGNVVANSVDLILEDLMASVEDSIKTSLRDGLIILTTFLMDPPNCEEEGNETLAKAETVVQEATSLISFLCAHEESGGIPDGRYRLVIDDSLEKINIVRTEIKEHYVQIQDLSLIDFPRTNVLGFIDFLLENLKEKASSITFAKLLILAIEEKLRSIRAYLKDLVEQQNEFQEQKNLWIRITNAAYAVEHVIDSCFFEDDAIWHKIISLSIFKDEIELTMTEVKKIRDEFVNNVGCGNIAEMNSGSTISKHVKNSRIDESIVGFKNEAAEIIDELTRGSRELKLVSIVGMPGREIMVHFSSSKSSSGQHLLVICNNESDPMETATTLMVNEALSGKYAGPLPKATITRPMKDWSIEVNFKGSRSAKAWILRSSTHQSPDCLEALPSLGRRIINKEVRWGSSLDLPGEFRFKERYWEWAQDILSRCEKVLLAAKIYEAVYASLFTYDRNSNIMKAFCEAWCPSTNTLLTTAGEVSISLWDLHELGGLPILGNHYDEAVPLAAELTGVDYNNKRFVPRSCEFLFHAYHLLKKGGDINSGVTISKWINFWFKRATKYGAPPPREERRSRPKFTENPCGIIPQHGEWTSEEEALFVKLNIKSANNKEQTFLAAFLSCWLCIFVLPKAEVDLIRPTTFKMASLMACGEQINLAVPVLASIYRGLNLISNSTHPSEEKSSFPAHYVYGWLAHFFKTHFEVPQGLKGPHMTTFSGEGSARSFNDEEARKRIHRGENIVWAATTLPKHKTYNFVDSGNESDAEQGYFLSLRSCFLPVREGNHFIIESYSPHRFSRQFGFLQDTPGYLKPFASQVSLEEGLRLWVTCTFRQTMSKVTFPAVPYSVKKHYTSDFKTWWGKVYGSYHEDNIAVLSSFKDASEKVECISITKRRVSKDAEVHQNSRDKKDSSRDEKHSSAGRTLSKEGASSSSKKHELFQVQGDSSCSKDRCWKRTRVDDTAPIRENKSFRDEGDDHIFVDVEALSQDSVRNSHSPKANLHEEVSSCKKSDLDLGVRRLACSNVPAISVFEGKPFAFNYKKKCIADMWHDLYQKIKKTPLEQVSSLEEQVFIVLEEMREFNVLDISPLEGLLKSFFTKAHEFDHTRSSSSEKMAKEIHVQLLSTTNQRLSTSKVQIDDLQSQIDVDKADLKKVEEEVLVLKRKLKRLRKSATKLSTLLEGKENQLAKEKSFHSTIEGELASLENTPTLNVEDEVKLKEMKEHLTAFQEDLENFKLFP